MESFGTIAELSKNAKEATGTLNNEVLYSCSEVLTFRLKNCLKTIKNQYFF